MEAGGLERMLSRTHIDDRHPLTREWAVFAVRNLTLGDSDLQARVARLQPQGVERKAEEQLRRMGLEPRFAESGKLVVDRVSPVFCTSANTFQRPETPAAQPSPQDQLLTEEPRESKQQLDEHDDLNQQ